LREGARLQTFPDSFQFAGTQEEIAALIGNAVPPLLSERIADAAYRYLATDARMMQVPTHLTATTESRQIGLFADSE
jgi:DNA (cytosine-5)-methyltransferase 1